MIFGFGLMFPQSILIIVLVFLFAVVAAFEPITVMCEINGFRVPAIVDTGAEVSVISTSCAKRCGLLNSIDTQHCGQAVGVGSGSSEIVGGIDKLGLKLGPLNFQSRMSVLRNSRWDLLIGLDVLRRFDCDVSLVDNALKMRVRGDTIKVPFLQRIESTLASKSRLPHKSQFSLQEREDQKLVYDYLSHPSQAFDEEFEDEEEEEMMYDATVSMEGV